MTDWLDRLMSIQENCQVKNWDSYSADPIDPDAIRVAKRLCESLDVTPNVDGGVTVSLALEGLSISIAYDGEYGSLYVDTEDLANRIRYFKNH